MKSSGCHRSPLSRGMFFIQLAHLCFWIEVFLASSLGQRNTNQANFGVCRSSFFDLPSITLFNTLGPIQHVCIPPYQPSIGNPIVCGGTSGHYDNNLACIAVYYLRGLNIPLLTAFHIQASNSRPLQPPPNINRRTCMNYNGGWKYVALGVNGVSPVKCPLRRGDWNFRIGTFANQYNRGHLVPCKLGKQISIAVAGATFNIFNVGPQHVDVNQALAHYEDLVIAFATEKCLRKDVIEGNVVQDFYFVSGTSPSTAFRRNKWIDINGAKSLNLQEGLLRTHGSNIPGLFWTACCCKYTFPKQMRSFTVTMSYFSENKANRFPNWEKSINDLKYNINYLYQTYFPKGLNVNSIFGYSACESTFSFSEIADILNVHTGGTSPANQNSDVKKYMMNLKPDPPAVSNFPDEPNGWTWAIR